MGKLKRKNLMVDAEKVEELARRRQKSESAVVREAVDFALMADEVIESIRKLHESGGIDDVFGHLADKDEP